MPEVQLATYDISGGLARSLSTQFLGVQIDLIPHTGVVVDGTEYFFGGGIQRMAHASFKANHGISPISLAEVGVTSKTSAEISSWISTNNHRFTASTYDLLSHNCNNFSHAFLTECLGLTEGVPSHILDIPRQFISSPMGAMVAPMISNMYQPFNTAVSPSVPLPPAPATTTDATINSLDFSSLLNNFNQTQQPPTPTAPTPVPAPPPPPQPADYSEQLAELQLMGFSDEAKNKKALETANGDIGGAIDILGEE